MTPPLLSHSESSAPSAPRRAARLARSAVVVGAVLVPLALLGLSLVAIGDDGEAALDRIPAAVVNEDELLTTTGSNGEEQVVFAGRQLVTELTAPDAAGFDWRVTNAEEAQAALDAGEVYAVLTIPDDFSASVLTIGTPEAVQAQLEVETDDAHSYLAGSVVQIVGQGLAAQFGDIVTEQYVDGLVGGLDQLGTALDDASEGAAQIGDGVGELGSGLDGLRDGAEQSTAGAQGLADGVGTYTQGVSSLSSGLGRLDAGAARLDQFSGAVSGLSGGSTQLAGGLQALAPSIAASGLGPAEQGAYDALVVAAQELAGGAGQLNGQLTPAIDGVQSAIGQSAAGARELAASGGVLAQSVGTLADGLGALGRGAGDAADGAREIAAGADELATGLSDGAAQVPKTTDSSIALNPVTVGTERANPVDGIGSVIAATLVPIGLWAGALATFLALRPAGGAVVGSATPAGLVLRRTVGRASLVAIAQAALVTLLVHAVAGVDWVLLPATLALTALIALALTAFHAALALTLGRGGMVISLLLLGVQIIVTGGIIPTAALADPFPALSAVMPLRAAVDGLQSLFAGGDATRILAMIGAMIALGAASLLVARIAVGRAQRREARAAFAPALA